MGFEEKESQTESKRNETFGNVIFSPNMIQETWTLLQGTKEAVTRVGAPPASWAPWCSTDVLLPPIYTHITPNDQMRSQKPNSTAATFCIHETHLGACSGAPPEEGRHHRGLLHHHSLFDEVWSSFPQTFGSIVSSWMASSLSSNFKTKFSSIFLEIYSM